MNKSSSTGNGLYLVPSDSARHPPFSEPLLCPKAVPTGMSLWVPAVKSDDKQNISSNHCFALGLHGLLAEARSYAPVHVLFIPVPLGRIALGPYTRIF